MRINLPKDFYLLLLSLLPEDIGVRLTNFVSLTRQSDRMYQQKHRKTDRQTDRKNVSLTSPQTAEISSKSPFSGEKTATLAPVGGERGGSLNTVTSNTVTDNDVTSTIVTKEKNIKKRKEKIPENYTPEYLEFWEIYRKSNDKKKFPGFEIWQRQKKLGILPPLEFLKKAVFIKSRTQSWMDGFKPMITTFLSDRLWDDIEEQIADMEKKQAAMPAQTHTAKPMMSEAEMEKNRRDFAEQWKKFNQGAAS